MTDQENNGWNEWRNHVLIVLKQLQTNHDELTKQLNQLSNEIITLKVKASLWGGLSGVVTAVATSFFNLFNNK